MVTLRLKPGEDIYAALQDFVEKEKIEAAFIATCVGSLTEVSIRYANQETSELLKGHYEILSQAGTLSTNGMHLHISIADGAGNCKGGPLPMDQRFIHQQRLSLGFYQTYGTYENWRVTTVTKNCKLVGTEKEE